MIRYSKEEIKFTELNVLGFRARLKYRSPLPPLIRGARVSKGGESFKVPLSKGDIGGSIQGLLKLKVQTPVYLLL
jgi:hypothetical protein